jgi:hypothetical protein
MGPIRGSSIGRRIVRATLVTAVSALGTMSIAGTAAHAAGAATRTSAVASHWYVPEATPSVRTVSHQPATPAPISSFAATTVTDTSVGLSWKYPAASDFTGVVIRRNQGATPPASATSGTEVATLSTPTQSYTDSGLTGDTQYAYAAFGSTASSQYAAGADLVVTTAPGPVTSLSVTGTTASTISMSWSAPAGTSFQGVLIRRNPSSTPPASPTAGTLVARVGRSTLSYTDADLSPGMHYSYSFFSYDASSHYSAPATTSGTTLHATTTTVNACANGDMVSTSQTWSPTSATAYDVGCTLTIESGVSLTIAAGTVVKLSAGEVLVGSGASLHVGTAGAAPVIFTSYRDSSVGGVVTGDGSPQMGDYMAGVELEEQSTAVIKNAVFRYGNASVADGLYVPCGTAGSVSLTLESSLIFAPVTLGTCTARGNASYVVSRNIFALPTTASAAFAIANVSTDTLSVTANWFDFAGLAGEARAIWVNLPVGIDVAGSGDALSNTFAPSVGATLVGVNGTIPFGSTWPVDLPRGVSLVNSGGPSLTADGTVTVGAGTVVGDTSTGPMVLATELTGLLSINGTAAAPVAMTNNSVIEINGSGTADVTHAVFSGTFSTESLGSNVIEGSCAGGAETVDLQNSTFDSAVILGSCAGNGNTEDITISQNVFQRPTGTTFLQLSAHGSQPGEATISDNTFSPTAVATTQTPASAVIVDGWPLEGIDLAGASTNLFTGTGTDRVVEVLESEVSADQTWEVNPAGGVVLMLVDTNYQVAPAVTVNGTVLIDPGTVLKFNSGVGMYVAPEGTLEAQGTAAAPAVFTSYKDDSVDGDSNGDGASTGTPAGSGGDYSQAIEANPDTTIDITHAVFRDGLWAIAPPYNVTPAAGGSATISHSSFADELELGDTNGTQVPYVATVTNNTWTFNGATSGQFAAGGGYDPSALQPSVFLANMDPSGFSLNGSTSNKFTGTGAGRVVALLGTTIAGDNSWTVNPASGVVLAPWQDDDFLPNSGIDALGGLTLMPGTLVKSNETDAGIEFGAGADDEVDGVTFTAIADDSLGGDSNGDGSLSSPTIGAYGTAIQIDENAAASLNGDTFSYASTAVDTPSGGGVSLMGSTFTSNDTAVQLITGIGTSDTVSGNVFNGNDFSLDATSTWIPWPSCFYVPTIMATNNEYSGSMSPLVSDSDYTALLDAADGLGIEQYPDNWVDHIAAGDSDFIEGWGFLPCDDTTPGSDDSYTALAIPFQFGS